MGKHVTKRVVHRRETNVFLPADEVRQALLEFAARKADVRLSGSPEVKLRVSQETGGSPPYGVDRWNAHIGIVEDLTPQPAVERADTRDMP